MSGLVSNNFGCCMSSKIGFFFAQHHIESISLSPSGMKPAKPGTHQKKPWHWLAISAEIAYIIQIGEKKSVAVRQFTWGILEYINNKVRSSSTYFVLVKHLFNLMTPSPVEERIYAVSEFDWSVFAMQKLIHYIFVEHRVNFRKFIL